MLDSASTLNNPTTNSMTRKSITIAGIPFLATAIFCGALAAEEKGDRKDTVPPPGAVVLNPAPADLQARGRTVFLSVDGMC